MLSLDKQALMSVGCTLCVCVQACVHACVGACVVCVCVCVCVFVCVCLCAHRHARVINQSLLHCVLYEVTAASALVGALMGRQSHR